MKNSGWLSRLRNYPLHTLIFAAYPILALLVSNLTEVSLSTAARPLILSFLATIVVFLVLKLMVRDDKKAALITSAILILFYSYGHIYILLKGVDFQGIYLFRHRTLIPIMVGGSSFLFWRILRESNRISTATLFLNAAGLYLLVFSLYQLTSFLLQMRTSQAEANKNVKSLQLKVDGQPPDIYFIILDGYARSDVLKNKYGYDNSGFLNALKKMGFYVAECSQSNYAQTQLSLSSALNFNYLDSFNGFVPGMDDRTGLDAFIKHSTARENLEAAGYRTVSFATGFLLSELYDADYYLAPEREIGELNEFERLLLQTTFARTIQDGRSLGVEDTGSELFRKRTLFALDKLDKLSYIKEPKFVFVHLIVPHPPYVFGPRGGPISPQKVGTTRSESNVMLYRDQVIFISNRMRRILPKIIANSARPPIIVMMGDHGPTTPRSPATRMSNLSAFYLPDADITPYPTITPVNTFRLIFNAYFGQNLPLLPDMSHYSNYDDPFSFRTIPNECGTRS